MSLNVDGLKNVGFRSDFCNLTTGNMFIKVFFMLVNSFFLLVLIGGVSVYSLKEN